MTSDTIYADTPAWQETVETTGINPHTPAPTAIESTAAAMLTVPDTTAPASPDPIRETSDSGPAPTPVGGQAPETAPPAAPVLQPAAPPMPAGEDLFNPAGRTAPDPGPGTPTG